MSSSSLELSPSSAAQVSVTNGSIQHLQRAHYEPPWSNVSIIGIAGSSGSGKTSLSLAIIRELSLPWVVILSMDSFYKVLSAEESAAAFRNEYDFDAPEAIDFDVLVERLQEVKAGRKLNRHYFVRKLKANDRGKQVLRDVRERGRDIEGCIKQWFGFVKPNFHKYVEPQRNVADIIVPRGVENKVAISMVCDRIHKTLNHKSKLHQLELRRLGKVSEDDPLSENIDILQHTNQVRGINSLLMSPELDREDFIFYFDRLATMLVEKATNARLDYTSHEVSTPVPGQSYHGLRVSGEISAVVILRGGSCLETGLKRVIPDCRTGRILVQTNYRTGEPELHFHKLADDISEHECVMLLDPQMSSGGAALMTVRILLDHGVREENIVFVTYMAGKHGLNRLMSVYPDIHVIVCRIVGDFEPRWVEQRYMGC